MLLVEVVGRCHQSPKRVNVHDLGAGYVKHRRLGICDPGNGTFRVLRTIKRVLVLGKGLEFFREQSVQMLAQFTLRVFRYFDQSFNDLGLTKRVIRTWLFVLKPGALAGRFLEGIQLK